MEQKKFKIAVLPYDYARCDGGECNVKKSCLRFKAPGRQFNQSYVSSKEQNPEFTGCPLYLNDRSNEGQ